MNTNKKSKTATLWVDTILLADKKQTLNTSVQKSSLNYITIFTKGLIHVLHRMFTHNFFNTSTTIITFILEKRKLSLKKVN